MHPAIGKHQQNPCQINPPSIIYCISYSGFGLLVRISSIHQSICPKLTKT